ncbi:hypothetical protein AB0N20_27495 [Streptomyces griseoincarnatus]
MTRQIDTRTPQAAGTQPATVQACQADRAGRPGSEGRAPSAVDQLRAAEASVQRAVTVPNPSAGRPFRKG